jgi:hypothetical protein
MSKLYEVSLRSWIILRVRASSPGLALEIAKDLFNDDISVMGENHQSYPVEIIPEENDDPNLSVEEVEE